MFKTIAMVFFIILDVIFFPFSCTENKNKNQCIFIVEVNNVELEISFYEQECYKIPEDSVATVPENFVNFEKEGYHIVGWLIYEHSKEPEDMKEVTLPYNITEEDYLNYFRGHKDCVVFMAKLEYTTRV